MHLNQQNILNLDGDVIGIRYDLPEGHVMEFKTGLGQRRAKVCWREGHLVWEKDGGLARFEGWQGTGY